MLSTRHTLQISGHKQTESEGMEKIFHENGNQKKAGAAILISEKIDFKIKTITRDKEGHYIKMKGSIQEKIKGSILIVNIYAPNIGAPQIVRQMLTAIKGEINSNTVVGDFNTPCSPMDRSSKMKINKETQALNDTLNMDLIDIYRIFHPKTTEYTSFLRAHGTLSRIDHILGHKSSLGKLKKIEIISSISSNHNAMRLDINYRKKNCKKYKHMEAKQYTTKLPRDHWRNQRGNQKIPRNK